MVVSRCRGIGPPSSGIVLGTVLVGCRSSFYCRISGDSGLDMGSVLGHKQRWLCMCLAGSPMGWPSYLCRVLFARAPVLGLCFFVSVNALLDHRLQRAFRL